MLQDKSSEIGLKKLNYFSWDTVDRKTYGCEFHYHINGLITPLKHTLAAIKQMGEPPWPNVVEMCGLFYLFYHFSFDYNIVLWLLLNEFSMFHVPWDQKIVTN